MLSSLIVAGAVVLALIAVSLAFRHRRADSAGVSPGTAEGLRNALNREQPTTRAELEADLQKISKSLKPPELAEVKAMVAGMYESATTPMSRRLYEPEELAVPAEWFPRRSREDSP